MNQDNVELITQDVMRELRACGVRGGDLIRARSRCRDILRPLRDGVDDLGAGDYAIDQLKSEFGIGATSLNEAASNRNGIRDFLNAANNEENRKKGFAFWSRGGKERDGE